MSKEVATRTKAPTRRTRSSVKPASPRTMMSYEDVARRAFEIYLSRDSHEGDQLSDWFRAEQELLAS